MNLKKWTFLLDLLILSVNKMVHRNSAFVQKIAQLIDKWAVSVYRIVIMTMFSAIFANIKMQSCPFFVGATLHFKVSEYGQD